MACGCESGHQGGKSPQHARGGHTPHRGEAPRQLGLFEAGRAAFVDYGGYPARIVEPDLPIEAGAFMATTTNKPSNLSAIIAVALVGAFAFWLVKD